MRNIRRLASFLALVLASALASSLASCGGGDSSTSTATPKLQLSFTMGADSGLRNIYVAWIEDSSGSFIQNLGICEKLLISGALTGTVLPYWKTKVYPLSDSAEVDAVTSATLTKQSFTLEARTLKDSSQRKFKVYFEVDRTWDGNDWFDNQPAVLYAADVDLDSGVSEYALSPIGWSRNGANINVADGDPPASAVGELQTEMRYVTDTNPFGTADADAVTNMVAGVSLKVL